LENEKPAGLELVNGSAVLNEKPASTSVFFRYQLSVQSAIKSIGVFTP